MALSHFNAKLRVTEEIFKVVVKYFESEAKVYVDYLQWTAGFWKIWVADGTGLKNVPSQIDGWHLVPLRLRL